MGLMLRKFMTEGIEVAHNKGTFFDPEVFRNASAHCYERVVEKLI